MLMLSSFVLESIGGVAVFVTILFTLICGLFILNHIQTIIANECMPPGPTPLPIIGNCHLIFGKNIDDVYRRLGQKYGNIFTFYIGRQVGIVVRSEDLIQEVLNRSETAGRPSGSLNISPSNSGVLRSEGSIWKANRKFCIRHLGRFGGMRKYEDIVMNEVDILSSLIKETAGSRFNYHLLVSTSVTNIICTLVFGDRYEHGDREFADFLEAAEKVAQLPYSLLFIPFLRFLPGIRKKFQRFEDGHKTIKKIISSRIFAHKSDFDEDNIDDVIDAFIQGGRHVDLSTTNKVIFEENQFTTTIWDLFAAGSETTSTTLRWGMAFLLNFPDIQEKMQKEIHHVVGPNRKPSLEDQKNLPYVQAVLAEIQRKANILKVPYHRTVSSVNVRGFTIPSGTLVLPDLTSANCDEMFFPNPELFRPERFLDGTGNFDQHLADKTLPFGVGKRRCPGEALARMKLFLFFVSLLQRFRFYTPDGALPPSLEALEGFITTPRPFDVCASSV